MGNKLDLIYNKEFSLPLLSPTDNKDYTIEITKKKTNSNILLNPAIIKDDDKFICNYKKILSLKDPICPDLYSQPITLNIISLLDETIKAEIVEIKDNYIDEKDDGNEIKNEEEKEKVENEGEKNGNIWEVEIEMKILTVPIELLL